MTESSETPNRGVQTVKATDDPRGFGRQRPAGATASLPEETGDNGREVAVSHLRITHERNQA
jgi:hypothetical protein